MKKLGRFIFVIGLVTVVYLCGWCVGDKLGNRYPVGQPVPSSVYTEPFDPCDPAYKFMQIRYGDPNKPKWQAAPDDWVRIFGNNERTMLLQTVSELRVVVAAQGKRLIQVETIGAELVKRLVALEDWQKKQPVWFEAKSEPGYRSWTFGPPSSNNDDMIFSYKDPNEAKR